MVCTREMRQRVIERPDFHGLQVSRFDGKGGNCQQPGSQGKQASMHGLRGERVDHACLGGSSHNLDPGIGLSSELGLHSGAQLIGDNSRIERLERGED